MILTINAGSSNIKFSLYEPTNLSLIIKQQVDSIDQVYAWLEGNQKYNIEIIGHRIVHGGKLFSNPILLTSENIAKLKELIPLAPLHQPHNIAAIEALQKIYPNIKQIGCFDTAFHITQAKLVKQFAIPNELTNEGIIRYGFHGLSYEYIASAAKEKLPHIAHKKLIVAHLGNGSSMCAIENSQSVATSMGFSALDGLVMGTRCGNIDPGVLLYLMDEKGYSYEQISDLLYNKSGLLGVSEISNDVRILTNDASAAAQFAIDLYCYRAAQIFGSLYVTLQGCDGIIFTGGIGENSAKIRFGVCKYLNFLGFRIDQISNKTNELVISEKGNQKLICVLPTNEELIIARHTRTFMH
jgi:acetate kinase